MRFIKLNSSLSRRLATSERLDVETSTLLEALKVLGIGVIADFVEDTKVLRRLKRRGVRHVQGFAIYRPFPLEVFGEAVLRVA